MAKVIEFPQPSDLEKQTKSLEKQADEIQEQAERIAALLGRPIED